MPLADAKARLDRFRVVYRNDYADFMGGEPTLYPHILPLIEHAAAIGLRPTVITHGMQLAYPLRAAAYRAAGIHDVLLSVHGLGDRAREIHGRGRDNHAKQLAAMANLRSLGVPFRFNVTLIRDNLDQLEDIARLAADQGARVVNFLTFNPYFEWTREPEIPFQVRHSDVAGPLARALDACTAAGVEANVRYMPICQLPGREHHAFTGYQLPFDEHEWDYNSWYDDGEPAPPTAEWYLGASDRQRTRHQYAHAPACGGCALRRVCDGFHEQYLARWGGDEARPYPGPPIEDPAVHVRRQRKLRYIDAPADFATPCPAETGAVDGRPGADGRAGRTRPARAGR